jgi:hypothetical protein
VDYSDSEDEDNMIGLAESVKGKKTVSCPFGKKESEKFSFNITKADKIFDVLLQQGQIKLSQFHTIPSAEELKRMKYCKWQKMQCHMTSMIAKSSDNRSNQLLSKEGLNLKLLQNLNSR